MHATLRASASRNSNSILFYHSKEPLYHYTILFYNISSIPNFYFPILLIKIIYPKTQIKKKTQIITYYHHHGTTINNHQPIIDPKPINPSTTTAPIKPINPTNLSAPIKKTTEISILWFLGKQPCLLMMLLTRRSLTPNGSFWCPWLINDDGLPSQAFFNTNPFWVTGANRLVSSPCDRARQG